MAKAKTDAVAKADVQEEPEQVNDAAAEEHELLELAAKTAATDAQTTEKGDRLCPLCGYTTTLAKEDSQIEQLSKHLLGSHPMAISAFAMNPELGIEAYSILVERKKYEDMELRLPPELGIDPVDELDDWDYLQVDRTYKKQVEATGGKLRWCTMQNVSRYQQRGYRLAEADQLPDMPFNHNHEDNTVRTNEMVLMVIPEPVVAKQKELHNYRVAQQSEGLINRGEQNEQDLDEKGRQIFNYYTRVRGMPAANAMKVTNMRLKRLSNGEPMDNAMSPEFQEGTKTVVHRGRM